MKVLAADPESLRLCSERVRSLMPQLVSILEEKGARVRFWTNDFTLSSAFGEPQQKLLVLSVESTQVLDSELVVGFTAGIFASQLIIWSHVT